MGKSPVTFPFIILEKYKPRYIMSPTVRSDTGIAIRKKCETAHEVLGTSDCADRSGA